MTGADRGADRALRPGFRELVSRRHAMGPADLEARNANYIGGDINGGAATLRQLWARPVLRPVPYSDARPAALPLLGLDAAGRRRARHVRVLRGAGGAARRAPLRRLVALAPDYRRTRCRSSRSRSSSAGSTPTSEARIIQKMTDALLEALEAEELRDHTWVLVEGYDPHRWGRGGKPWE